MADREMTSNGQTTTTTAVLTGFIFSFFQGDPFSTSSTQSEKRSSHRNSISFTRAAAVTGKLEVTAISSTVCPLKNETF
jgi:hypothetical protein